MPLNFKCYLCLLSCGHTQDVCICECVTLSVHLGGISHRCVHSSCSETSSSGVIYYPHSCYHCCVCTEHPPLLLQRPSPPTHPALSGLQPEHPSLANSRSPSWQQSGLLLSSKSLSSSFYNLWSSPNIRLSVFGSKISKGCL